MNTIIVMIFSGKNGLYEGNPIIMYRIINYEIVNDNMNFILVPHYGRNIDHNG